MLPIVDLRVHRARAAGVRAALQSNPHERSSHVNHLFARPARALIVALFACLLVLASGCGTTGSAADALAVNAIASDPSAFTGTIAVAGVVQNVDAAASSITLIDETEYATCGITPCGSAGLIPLVMPMSGAPSPSGALYSGQLPSLEEKVVVGEIKSSEQGLYFDVHRVERGGQTLIAKK
jgi:hypothetical protein